MCFRVRATLEWAEKTKQTTEQLVSILQDIGQHGTSTDFAERLLIAVVNQIPIEKVE